MCVIVVFVVLVDLELLIDVTSFSGKVKFLFIKEDFLYSFVRHPSLLKSEPTLVLGVFIHLYTDINMLQPFTTLLKFYT